LQRRAHIVARDRRMVRQDIGLAPSLGQKADDEFDGEAGAADDRLAGQPSGIRRDTGVVLQGGSTALGSGDAVGKGARKAAVFGRGA